jgi:hypothetical protein
MSGVFVGCGCVGRSIGLNEDKPSGVVLLLHDVEAADALLKDTVPRIFARCGFEGVDGFRFYLDVNMDNKHGDLSRRD